MLFNYGIRSNAEAIKKAMDKELIPLRQYFSHPNIVRMYSCFVDSFPLLREAHEYYPMAIPERLSPDGCGRNKTLFIVMRRYDLTLSAYIRAHQPDDRQRLLLFTQLLEALLYLREHSIVHRDLKSDNLLICEATGELVVADFGCALYHPPDLKISYQTDEVCKGGNLALMAPEVSAIDSLGRRNLLHQFRSPTADRLRTPSWISTSPICGRAALCATSFSLNQIRSSTVHCDQITTTMPTYRHYPAHRRSNVSFTPSCVKTPSR